jgi:hypothetical protein
MLSRISVNAFKGHGRLSGPARRAQAGACRAPGFQCKVLIFLVLVVFFDASVEALEKAEAQLGSEFRRLHIERM